jgi:hypothetical protein
MDSGNSSDLHNVWNNRAETLAIAKTPGTLLADRTTGETAASETTGASGYANSREARTDRNTIIRRDV